MTESLLLWVDGNTNEIVTSPKQTRNSSYYQITNDGTANKQADRVLEYISTHNFCSNADIEKDLHMRISSVTARINELRKKGLIQIAGSKLNPNTNKLNIVWSVQK